MWTNSFVIRPKGSLSSNNPSFHKSKDGPLNKSLNSSKKSIKLGQAMDDSDDEDVKKKCCTLF